MSYKTLQPEFSHMSSDTYLKIEYNFCRVSLFSGSFRSHVVTQGSQVFGFILHIVTLLYLWQIKKPRKHLNLIAVREGTTLLKNTGTILQ